jgi:hypothetical protein
MRAVVSVEDVAWAPPEWACNCFPLEAAGQELLRLETALAILHRLADSITDADSTALGPAIHVAHMLLAWQGADGRWPATLNANTGQAIGRERTAAPLTLYRRLADLLETSEFDHVIERSERLTGPTKTNLICEKES